MVSFHDILWVKRIYFRASLLWQCHLASTSRNYEAVKGDNPTMVVMRKTVGELKVVINYLRQ